VFQGTKYGAEELWLCASVTAAMGAFAVANVPGRLPLVKRSWPRWSFWAATGLAFGFAGTTGPGLILSGCLLFVALCGDSRGGRFFVDPAGLALFGLMIGAVMHRVGSPGRPYSRGSVVIGTMLVVLFVWCFTIAKESRDFPYEVAEKAAADPRARIGARPVEEFQDDVAEQVRKFLAASYAPGGTLGYIRWITTDGELEAADIELLRHPMERGQRGYSWIIRVVSSVALLMLSIGSQTWLLTKSTDRAAERDPDDESDG